MDQLSLQTIQAHAFDPSTAHLLAVQPNSPDQANVTVPSSPVEETSPGAGSSPTSAQSKSNSSNNQGSNTFVHKLYK